MDRGYKTIEEVLNGENDRVSLCRERTFSRESIRFCRHPFAARRAAVVDGNPFAAVKLLRRESILHRIIPYSYREISIDRKIILSCVYVRTYASQKGRRKILRGDESQG